MLESIEGMATALRASALRQKVLANNVSNVDTPYFQRSDVQFDAVLQEKLGFQGYRSHPRHLPIGVSDTGLQTQVVREPNGLMTNSVNNVDIEYEMEQMAQNSLWYSSLVQQLNHKIDLYRKVLEGVK